MTDFLGQLDIVDYLPLAVGVAFLVAGWAIYWFSINVGGAVLLGGAGLLLAQAIAREAELGGGATVAVQVGGVVAGVVLGVVMARTIHLVAFFLIGAAAGGALFYSIVSALRVSVLSGWAAGDAFFSFGIPIAALLGGFLAAVLSRLFLVVFTAIAGAVLVMEGLGREEDYWMMAGLAVAGVVVQLTITRPWRKKEPEAED